MKFQRREFQGSKAMTAKLESEQVFKARCKAVGLNEAALKKAGSLWMDHAGQVCLYELLHSRVCYR